MTRRTAICLMILAPFLWSLAGVATKSLHGTQSFEINTWRSGFAAIALLLYVVGRGGWMAIANLPWRSLLFWITGFGWAFMFTSFMLALTITTVANVLVMLAVGPLLTALIARAMTGQALPTRTWIAITVATLGLIWMFGTQWQLGRTQDVLGCLVALFSPTASAVVWSIAQRQEQKSKSEEPQSQEALDLIPTIMVGAALSALVTLPLALPLSMDLHDVSLLAGMGFIQLATPCVLSMMAARVLKAPEVALLALLEILFGITWAWLFVGEVPTWQVLVGGSLVLAALVGNVLLGARATPLSARADISPTSQGQTKTRNFS